MEFLQNYPDELTNLDDNGLSLIHRETLAGNLSSIEVILSSGGGKN